MIDSPVSRIRPIGSDILIHPIDDPSMTPSGLLHIPDAARLKRRTDQGIIIAFGPECSRDGLDLGDHVVFNGYSGDKVTLTSGGIYYVVPESHIIAVLADSDVVLMDTKTIKRIIQDRLGELRSNAPKDIVEYATSIEQALLDRIDSITIHEGLEW